MGEIRRTVLYEEHLALGGRMVAFGGWELPQQYTSIREEHMAVRTAAGLFDLGHMGRLHLSGAGAASCLQGILTNDVERSRPGRALYSLMCNEEGGILDDVVLYRHGENEFTVIVNASTRERDLKWMRGRLVSGVRLEDRSDQIHLLALQGPAAEKLLPAEGVDLAALAYFGFAHGQVAGVPTMIARTGYTGEDGFELLMPSEHAVVVWRAILEQGRERGLLPCGLGARDVCRLEAGLRLYGNDMDHRTSPYEAGLGWTVKLQKGNFVGREVLSQLKLAGPSHELVGLVCRGRHIPRHGCRVSRQGRQIGKVTSGTYSFWLRQGIAMASVRASVGVPGSVLDVETDGTTFPAEVVTLPFYRGSVLSPAAKS